MSHVIGLIMLLFIKWPDVDKAREFDTLMMPST
jgi:hypothetical protein